MKKIHVIGAGLAGSEAALAAAREGAEVLLYEMRPGTPTAAHQGSGPAELVCSNSLKSLEALSAPWQLKWEMLRLGSRIVPAAFATRVPAGSNLSVDRLLFSQAIEKELAAESRIEIRHERLDRLPEGEVCIVATGPLTEARLASHLQEILGAAQLYFYDAIAPIVTAESIDREHCFAASRWDRGEPDYLNCPLTKEEYEAFIQALMQAEKHPLHDFEEGKFFEGCLPIEETARRGPETLRFGPMKPVGLTDPKTGRRPWACVQLRRENAVGSLYNLVGFQTQLKWGDQEKLLRLIPALRQAEFARFGSLHRNTYLNAPQQLEDGLRLKGRPEVFFAGQITGVEGYLESAASGLLAGIMAARQLKGEALNAPPRHTMLGALGHYLRSSDPKHFQPINAMWGLFEPLPSAKKESKYQRFLRYRDRAQAAFGSWVEREKLPLYSAELVESLAREQEARALAAKETGLAVLKS